MQLTDFVTSKSVEEKLDQLTELTARIFPVLECVERSEDPELSSAPFFVFRVRSSAPVDELVEKNVAWHQQMLDIAGSDSDRFRLAIDAT